MKTYRVWCPDRGETEDDAVSLTCLRAIYAAEQWAELHAGFSGDPFDEINCMVAEGTGDAVEFTVDVECSPVFHASKVP